MFSPDFLAWRATRLPLALYVPFALLLALAAAGGLLGSQRGLATAALAFALVAQFRLWDDLVDRERDRRVHPQRVLARTRSAASFRRFAVALGIGNTLGLAALNGPWHGVGAVA
jgi:4-hydroxybenzoate polyprenyltransferase